MDLNCIITATINFTDIVLAVSAAVGAIVAILGLSTWKWQLKGQSEYALAKRILKLCYQYRDAISKVRDPIMLSSEAPLPPDEEINEKNEQQKRFHWRRKGYDARWEKVRSVRSDLYPELLESEVLWGKELSDTMKLLIKLETDLAIAIGEQLLTDDPDAPLDEKEGLNDLQMAKNRRELMYARPSREDSFGVQFKEGLIKIETLLKPHLKK